MSRVTFYSLCTLLFCCGLSALADETGNDGETKSQSTPKYQSIELPESELSKFPFADWIPIPGDRFEALLKRAGSDSDPAEVCSITRSRFHAEFIDGSLRDGTFVFSVRNSGGKSRSLALTPCTLPVREVSWRDRPVSSGTDSRGRWTVAVDREAGELVGKWDLAAIPGENGVSFEMQVPQSHVTTIEILVPNEFQIQADDPLLVVSQGVPENGKRICTISLGGRTSCEFTFEKRDRRELDETQIVGRQEDSYFLRRDGIRVRTQLQLDLTGGETSDLEFRLDSELQVLSSTLGADIQLRWTERLDDRRGRILRIHLSEALSGSGHQLNLQCFAPSQIGKQWRLPQINILNSVVEERRIVFQLESPLELRSIAGSGCRQDGITLGESPIRTFVAENSDPSLEVFVGNSSLSTECVVSGQILCEREYWTGEFELEFQASSGLVFNLPLNIQPEWEIIEVRAGVGVSAPTQEVDQWNVSDRSDGTQVLSIELQDALRAGSPCRTFVKIRRSSPVGEQSVGIPAVEPGFPVTRMTYLVRYLHQRQSAALLESGGAFEIVPSESLPEPWKDKPFFQDRPVDSEHESFAVLLKGSVPNGEMFLRTKQVSLTAVANVTADISEERVREQFTLKLSPEGRIDRVLVYLSDTGEEVKWSPQNAGEMSIDAVRVPSSRHAIWRVPPHGELWELSFSSPQTGPFEVKGDRAGIREERGAIALPWLPQADIFEGNVHLACSGAEVPRLEVQGGESLQFDHSDRKSNRRTPRIADWRYIQSGQQEFTSSISYSYSQQPATDSIVPIAAVRGVVRPGRNAVSVDLYEITFAFDTAVPISMMAFALPIEAETYECRVDDAPAEVSRRVEELRISSPSSTHGKSLLLRYFCPITTQGVNRVLLFPKPRFAISSVNWELYVPEGLSLVRWPSDWNFKDWRTPTGRPSFWPPFSLEPSSTPSAGPLPVGAPVGNRVWKYRTASFPDRVELKLWDQGKSVPLTWISLLTGIGLRLISRKSSLFFQRPALFPAAILSLLFLSVWVPVEWSYVFSAATIGLLIGTVVPRWWIPNSLKPQNSSKEIPSNDATRIGTVLSSAVVFFFGLVLCCDSFAQDQTQDSITVRADEEGSAVRFPTSLIPKVLIPIRKDGTDENPGSLIYLSPEWRPWLDRQTDESESLDTLPYRVLSAIHELEIDESSGNSYRMKIEVEIRNSENVSELEIPLSNVKFGGRESCLVDGSPCSLFAVPGKSAVRVSLQSVLGKPEGEVSRNSTGESDTKRFSIELSGFPVVKGDLRNWTWESEIPRSVDSLLIARFQRPTDHFRPTSSRGASSWSSDGRELRIPLGNVPTLAVEFSPPKQTDAKPSQFDVAAVGHMEIGSGTLNLTYLFRSEGIPKKPEPIRLQLPSTAIVRELSFKGKSVRHDVRRTEKGKELQFVLSRDVPEASEWKLKFQIPRSDSSDTIVLPALDWVPDGERDRIRISDHLLAIGAPTGHQLECEAEPMTAASPVDLTQFGTEFDTAPISPRFVYRMTSPAKLKFKLLPTGSLKNIRDNRLQAVIRRDRTTFVQSMTILPQAEHPRFEYEIQVPSSLRIDNASITEDGANRILNWARHGDRMTLFLREPTTGEQQLVIEASDSLGSRPELNLPEFRLIDSTPADRRIDLAIAPNLRAEWLNSSDLRFTAETEGPTGLNAEGDVEFGSWIVAKERRIPLDLRIFPNDPRVAANLATIVKKAPNAWQMETHVVFRVENGYATQFKLLIPASLQSPRINSPGATQAVVSVSGQSANLVTLTPLRAVSDQFHVTVSSSVTAARSTQWTVPKISILDCKLDRSFIAFNPLEITEDFDPVETRLRAATMIPELAEAIPKDSLAQCLTFESDRADNLWVLPLRSTPNSSTHGPLVFAEDQLRFVAGNQIEGRLSVTMAQPQGRHIELEMPLPLQLSRVTANGRLLEAVKRRDRIVIRLPDGSDLNRIDIDWIQKKVDNSPLPVETRIFLPRVTNPIIDDRFAIVRLLDGDSSFGASGGNVVAWWDFVLRRSEWLASLPVPIQMDGEYGGTLLEQLRGVVGLWKSERFSPLTESQSKKLSQLETRLRVNDGAIPLPTPTTTPIAFDYPDPRLVKIYQIGPTDTEIGVRLVPRQLLLVLVTSIAIAIARFLLPRVSGQWMNDFSDRYPALGWLCCGIAWAFLCTPAYGAVLFVFPAALAWWASLRKERFDGEDLLNRPESLSSEFKG